MNRLLSFAFITMHNERGYWVRCVTIRAADDGSWAAHYSDLELWHGRRLADRLCDRYGITDRACLHSGRIFTIAAPTSAGGAQ